MIEIPLSIGAIIGYIGSIWCVGNLIWGLFRNDARRCLIYGIGTFAALIVGLNVGGVLNEHTWAAFGMVVFGLHVLYTVAGNFTSWKFLVYFTLFTTSFLSYVGVI